MENSSFDRYSRLGAKLEELEGNLRTLSGHVRIADELSSQAFNLATVHHTIFAAAAQADNESTGREPLRASSTHIEASSSRTAPVSSSAAPVAHTRGNVNLRF